jgi:ABC-2 type transport system permease protein
MPLFFLSGTIYPLAGLPKALSILTSLDPLAYGVDGMRAALIAQSHFGVVTDLSVLAIGALVLIGVGAWRFSKIEV